MKMIMMKMMMKIMMKMMMKRTMKIMKTGKVKTTRTKNLTRS